MESSWFIFRKFYFLLANASGLIRITYKGNEENLKRACARIDQLVTENNRV